MQVSYYAHVSRGMDCAKALSVANALARSLIHKLFVGWLSNAPCYRKTDLIVPLYWNSLNNCPTILFAAYSTRA